MTGLFFVLAGINKLLGYGPTLTMMGEAGLPVSGLLLPLVIMLEIGGGAVVMLGRNGRWLVYAALALAAFTLMTNAVFHQFWTFEGVMAELKLSLFFKNIVIFGALLMIAGTAFHRKTQA